MRRLLIIVLLTLVLLPAAAFAQDSRLIWEIDKGSYLDVTDLGFRFYYPVGWVWGTGDNGIAIAPTQKDLDAQLDDSPKTLPADKVITILGIPLTALSDQGETLTLDQMVDLVVESGGITESERFELPVMSRRAIWVAGENSLGRSGVASIWTQNGYLILASIGAPDAATLSDSIFSWSYTLSGSVPLETEDLGEGVLSSDVSQFTMRYPETWTPDPDANQTDSVVYELADDINQELAEVDGIFLSVIDSPLADLSFPADTTAEDLSAAMSASFGLTDDATKEEFVFLDQPAVVTSGAISDGSGGERGIILTSAVVGDNATVFVLIAPTAERAAEFLPTWTSMMQSVVSTATA